jgi:oligoendopeptidase F
MEISNVSDLLSTKTNRSYLPINFSFAIWSQIAPFFEELKDRPINTVDELHKWLVDRSELEAAIQEDVGWRYIRMSCDTTNEQYSHDYNFFVTDIQPQLSPFNNDLDLKLLNCKALVGFSDPRFQIVIRQIRSRVAIFREINIPLIAELQQKEQEFAAISSAMTIEVDGKEITMQQAGNYLELPDRDKREEVYRKMMARRIQDQKKLDDLFDGLVKLRHQIALNADFNNYRDYMFAALGRFDYNAEDCFKFHDAVAKYLVPIASKIEQHHKSILGLDNYRPWDVLAEPNDAKPLRPFLGANDLMEKSIACFNEMDPFLGACLKALKDENRLDLESRKGKAPGGYNYPLYETGMPFIFMNSTNTLRDLVTIVHEGGHAVHSIVDKPLELVEYKSLPSEVAELASMSMELMSMEYWNHFFNDEMELKRARQKHLEDVLKGLPWIAAVDAFQHWIYLNPTHTASQRRDEWTNIYNRFSSNEVDWSGLENVKSNIWQKQLHIFEVPFYYIEYGFAQLGAIAVWKNFKEDQKLALQKYINALSLGYTKSIGEIYETAGARFDFSDKYVNELASFVNQELGN